MATILKQSTAVDVLIGPFVDSTDGVTAETALSLTSAVTKLSKNGQTLASRNDATTCVHDADGMYNCELDATDTNTVGTLVISVQASGALPVRHEFQVVEESIYDALYAASAAGFDSNGRVDVGSWLGTAVTLASTSKPDVNVFSNKTIGYLGRIWLDDGAANTNTTDYIDGVCENPVSTLAAAATISTSMGINTYTIAAGSSFTLAATLADKLILGDAYTIALGSQSISGTVFENFASISGTATGASAPSFNGGSLGAVTLPPSFFTSCGFTNTFTANGAGNYYFSDCYDQVAGASVASFDFSAQGSATTAQFMRYSGGASFTLDSNATVMFEAVSGGTITVNGTGGTIHIRGMVSVTDSSGGSVTIVQTQALSNTSINAEADTAISDAALATAANLATVDSVVDAIKVITDALGATAAARLALSAGQIIPGTVSNAVLTPTTTAFAADDITEATADHYNGRIVIFTSGALAGQATDITDYSLVSSEGNFTVTAMTEAPTNNDTFVIV